MATLYESVQSWTGFRPLNTQSPLSEAKCNRSEVARPRNVVRLAGLLATHYEKKCNGDRRGGEPCGPSVCIVLDDHEGFKASVWLAWGYGSLSPT